MHKTYLEDLTVGQSITMGQWLIHEAECVEFARQWEPQPHHLSDEAAGDLLLSRLTVCSLYLFAVCTRLFFDYERPLAVVAMLGKNDLVLPNPAYPGDRLIYRTRCIETRKSRSRPRTGIVTLADALSTDSGRDVLQQKVTLMVHRRPE